MRKVAVIGGGNVGATAAWQIASRDVADVALYDILPGVPAGKALDMSQAGEVFHFDARIEGSDKIEVIRGAEVVVVTAGFPRKPGMDRMDLLKKNVEIAKAAALGIKQHAPDAVVVVITNPLDVMTWVVKEVTGFPKQRVVGMAGVLDSARFARFIADELHCSVKDVRPMILGGHGDTMVPLARFSTVNGVPLSELMPAETIAKLADRARNGGAEIVKLLGTGSAYYAPAASATLMVEAILGDTGRILPCSSYLTGEYGFDGIYLGVPVALGAGGVRRVVSLSLDAAEKAALGEERRERPDRHRRGEADAVGPRALRDRDGPRASRGLDRSVRRAGPAAVRGRAPVALTMALAGLRTPGVSRDEGPGVDCDAMRRGSPRPRRCCCSPACSGSASRPGPATRRRTSARTSRSSTTRPTPPSSAGACSRPSSAGPTGS